jgi:hypothetical protein
MMAPPQVAQVARPVKRIGADDDTWRHRLGIFGLEHCLDGVKQGTVDDRIDGNDHVLGFRFCFLSFPDLSIEAVLALVGGARQNLMQGPDSPGADARPPRIPFSTSNLLLRRFRPTKD